MEEPVLKTIYQEEVYGIFSKVAVYIGVPWHELKEEHRLLLSKILHAVRLSLESVRVIHQAQIDLSSWAEKPNRIIAFLAPPKGISTYEIIQSGPTSMVFSDPLEILQSDEAAKRKLWNTLKTLFSS